MTLETALVIVLAALLIGGCRWVCAENERLNR